MIIRKQYILFTRNKMLNKKLEEKETRIEKLEQENFSLKQTVRYFKDKFNKLKIFLQEKLFDWSKKESIYNKVINDLYDKGILDDNDIKGIEKGDYKL